MDNQNQQLTATGQTTNQQSVVPPTQTITVANQLVKPRLNIFDSEAQSILSINNLQVTQHPKTKAPIKLVIAAMGLIVIVVLVSYLIGSFKPGRGSNSSISGGLGLPSQSNPTSGSGVSKQINQDVKTCANPLSAATVC
jgi:hypothetical protein